jgi:magnesium-transporting ATPase (P-type)
MPELSVAIVVVILVNAVFSYFQEHRAEQAVAALRKLLTNPRPSDLPAFAHAEVTQLVVVETPPDDVTDVEPWIEGLAERWLLRR